MRNEVELYINGQLVELGEEFDINMTYTVEQTTNPTAIKNNYSKTVTIPATGKNNRIFSNIWNATSIYNNDFDLTKKADFQLFVNGNKIEEGYIKIDRVKKTNTSADYECTLFGGLGDFFYSLSTDSEGSKMKLSDLDYGGGEYEFDLMVDKDVIYNAWNRFMDDETEGSLYGDINFALCYNGIPEDFSSNKVLMETAPDDPFDPTDTDLPFKLPYAISGYSSVNGWVLANLKQDYDEWSSRDLRSYLQRPVFRVKTLFRGICNPENNGGYTVNLDSDFFNSDNPYWEKSWITLPLISEMEEIIEGYKPEVITGVTVDVSDMAVSFNRDIMEYKDVPVTVVTEETTSTILQFPIQLKIEANLNSTYMRTGYKYTLNNQLFYYNAPFSAQLIGINKTDGEEVYYSDVAVFTSYNDITIYNYKKLQFKGGEIVRAGTFERSGTTNTYLWDNVYSFRINNISNINDYDWVIRLSRYEYMTDNEREWYGHRYLDCVFPNGSGNGNIGGVIDDYDYIRKTAYSTSYTVIKGNDNEEEEDITILNKRKLTKKRMLSGDNTPLDYLLGYTKQMGLYFIKHPQEKVIDIVTRKTFYGQRNIIDLEELIDRGKEINITPLTFDRKWYDMGLEIEENRYTKIYDTYTNIPYGTKRIDTGYEYVKESNDLLKNVPYKAGLMVREKDAYMVNFRLPKDK